MRYCLAAALAHRHLVAGTRAAVDRLVDGAARPVGRTPDECHVGPAQGSGATMVGELPAELAVGMVGLGDHHQAGGVLVQAMDDARAPDAADPGQAVAAM